MSTRKKNNGSCVSRQECNEAMEPIKNTLVEVKNALIGKDLSSGLVKQVSNLDNKVTNIITEMADQKKDAEEKRKAARMWKIAALSSSCTLLGIFLEFVFSHFGH